MRSQGQITEQQISVIPNRGWLVCQSRLFVQLRLYRSEAILQGATCLLGDGGVWIDRNDFFEFGLWPDQGYSISDRSDPNDSDRFDLFGLLSPASSNRGAATEKALLL